MDILVVCRHCSMEDIMPSTRDHWNKIFSRTEYTKLGWYEEDTAQTFKLLDKIPGIKNATVFLPGAGTSILIEDLIPSVHKLILNDISDEALNRVRRRLTGDFEKIIWL